MRRILLTSALLALAGCAHPPGAGEAATDDCQGRTSTRTPYAPAPGHAAPIDVDLSTARPARVQVYRVRASQRRAQACGSVGLRHEVVLARRGTMVLREVREYYADDGTLIASNSEDVSEQLPASGRYTRSTTLPIPAAAPLGRYRVVSKLLVRTAGDRRFVQLGRAATSFYVE